MLKYMVTPCYTTVIECFSAAFRKNRKQRNCHLYSPCWVSKTLAQKPSASPVQRKIPNETKKRLVAQKHAIGEDYYNDRLRAQNRIRLKWNATVKKNFNLLESSEMKSMGEKKNKEQRKHLWLTVLIWWFQFLIRVWDLKRNNWISVLLLLCFNGEGKILYFEYWNDKYSLFNFFLLADGCRFFFATRF